MRTGDAVAAGGATVVVGAQNQDVTADSAQDNTTHQDILSNVGGAYIYQQQPNGRWEDPILLLPPDPQPGSHFGRHVATDGQTVVIGMRGYKEAVKKGADYNLGTGIK